jgi:L,D-transpeptidase catalytic domain/Putative peptidoglycan binding domain
MASALALSVSLVGLSGVAGASTNALRVRASVTGAISATMPLVRLAFSSDVSASQMPRLAVQPALATTWQQIGPREVQAVVTGTLSPLAHYVIDVPTRVSCSTRCQVLASTPRSASAIASVTWEDQLLATLHYLPLSFTPLVTSADPAQPSSGTYTWSYPNLPASLAAQWRQGQANVILTGALMAFQSDHQLASTGVADVATWNALVIAVENNDVDAHPYSYVAVSMASPETLTLYVAGAARFHTLVNTGISVSPTATGTYPVYLRYTSQTMSGTNPDGTHYSDPGIPWVSYFNGGDALHGFIRATYGWPQSLGCVEMPFAAAKTIWPSTPIGTLVTVS